MQRWHANFTTCSCSYDLGQAMSCCHLFQPITVCAIRHHRRWRAACIPLHASQALHKARRHKQLYSVPLAQQSPRVLQAELDNSVCTFLKVTEMLSLVSSVGLQAYALTLTYSQEAQVAASFEHGAYQPEPSYCSQQRTFTSPSWLSHFAMCALILTYILGKLHHWVRNGR